MRRETMFENRLSILVILAVSAALAIAALSCGSTNDSTQAGAGDEIVIGHVAPFTGSLAHFGEPSRNGADLAVQHVNDAGGIDGANLRVVHRDTGTNPSQGASEALSLVNDENAAAIVGGISSAVTIAVAETATVPNGRLQISPASTSPAITTLEDDDLLFRTTVSDTAQGIVLATLADNEGYDTAAVIFIDNAYGQGLADQFTETFTLPALGGTVTSRLPHGEAPPSYASLIEQAMSGDPDVLISISYPGQAEAYIPEIAEAGYEGKFILTSALKAPEAAAAIEAAGLDGTLGTSPGSRDTSSLQTFNGTYVIAYGEVPQHRGVAGTYDAVVLIALAAAKAGGGDDPLAIRDALRDVAGPPGEKVGTGPDEIKRALMLIADDKDIDYEGAAGSVDFDENGDVSGPIEIWKVENGEIHSTGRFLFPYVPGGSNSGPTAW